MTELELLIDLHRNSERQGPGSEAETLKALGLIDLPNWNQLKIADIGCGSGAQTFILSQNLAGKITAVDLFPEFLDELNGKSEKLGISDKITTLEKSMDDLPFRNEEFDIIWSEGAIYNIGFEAGIKQWKNYLKPGGYLAVSEITWLSHTRPSELDDFWIQQYPEIDLASNKIKILEDQGFILSGYFYLNQESWTDNYYQPLQAKFSSFLERHGHSTLAKKVVEEHQEEIELYQTYKDYYSYGFYVARKNQ